MFRAVVQVRYDCGFLQLLERFVGREDIFWKVMYSLGRPPRLHGVISHLPAISTCALESHQSGWHVHRLARVIISFPAVQRV